jgi:hypothetical protein
MKTKIIILSLILAGIFSAALPINATEINFNTGLMFNTWKDDDSDKGFQSAIPIELSADISGVNLDLLNAFVYTWVNQKDTPNANLGNFLDTKVNASYMLEDVIPVNILFGLGLNLPTGTTDLSQRQLILVADPDLMPFTTFGEGFNVNPYISISKEWQKLVFGIGAGYTYRGKYDYSESTQDFKPGNIITASVEAAYSFTDSIHAGIFGEYANYGTDTVKGSDYYKEGDLFVIGLGGGYSRPSWELDINLAGLFRNKSQFLTSEQILEPEAKNSHGIEYDAVIGYRYFLNDQTVLDAGFDFAYLGKNDYSSDSPYYIGNRTKFVLSGGIDRTFMDNLKGGVSINLYTIKEEPDWEHPDGSRTYYGGTVEASLSYTF